MSSGFYVERDSAFHRMHPAVKIIGLFMAFASAFIVEHPLWVAGLFALYALPSLPSGAWKGAGRVAWIMALIALASFIIWSLARDGEPVARYGPFTVTREGMLFGAGMGLRLDLMIFCGLVFLSTTTVEDMAYGLTRLGLPYAMAFSLSLSFRLVPLFGDTVRAIMDAQRARGLDPSEGGPLRRAAAYVPLLVPVFSSALRRTEQLSIALESRGFGLPVKRGHYREYKAGFRDALLLAALLAIAALLVAARLRGWGAAG